MAMLNGDRISQRLESGEIFRPGTWTRSQIGGASYDLRMADDFLIMPDLSRKEVGQTIKRLLLNPGEVALISTQERFCVPWNLVGNMSAKFSRAKEGVLVHTGSIVDPGFGLTPDGFDWKARDDERVHFIIANLSNEIVDLRPGDSIATIQFSEIDTPTNKSEKTSSREKIRQELFDGTGKPLSLNYFAYMKNAEKRTHQELDKIQSELRQLEVAAKGYQQLSFFGVYVLAAALLTMFGTLVLKDSVATTVISGQANIWFTSLLAATLIAILAAPIIFAVQIWRGDRRSDSPKK